MPHGIVELTARRGQEQYCCMKHTEKTWGVALRLPEAAEVRLLEEAYHTPICCLIPHSGADIIYGALNVPRQLTGLESTFARKEHAVRAKYTSLQ